MPFRLLAYQSASNSRFTYPLLYSSYVGENIAAEAEAGVSPGNGSHRLLLCLTASRAAGASSSAPQWGDIFSEVVFLISYNYIPYPKHRRHTKCAKLIAFMFVKSKMVLKQIKWLSGWSISTWFGILSHAYSILIM